MTEARTETELAIKLQRMLLQRWERLLEDEKMSPTDARTLAQFLRDNGWSLKLDDLPDGIRGRLTEMIDPDEIPSYR